MTLWRWLNDEELGFPQPRWIHNRRYWDERELDVWDQKGMRASPRHRRRLRPTSIGTRDGDPEAA
jgi:hypothetical protein